MNQWEAFFDSGSEGVGGGSGLYIKKLPGAAAAAAVGSDMLVCISVPFTLWPLGNVNELCDFCPQLPIPPFPPLL